MNTGTHNIISTMASTQVLQGCALSPLMGALYLTSLDAYAKANQLDYVRYLDDVVFFAKTRHQLRKIIKEGYPILNQMELTLAKDKTWIGRVTKGLDFLGYRISADELTVATRSLGRMVARANQQNAQRGSFARLAQYVKHWLQWATSDVVLNEERLLKKTTNVLQNAFGFQISRVILNL